MGNAEFSKSNIPSVRHEDELDTIFAITPENIADELGLTGHPKSIFISNARRKSVRELVREQALIDYMSARPTEPYDQINAAWDKIDNADRLKFARRAGQLRFEISQEFLDSAEGKKYFRAWFLDMPSVLEPMRADEIDLRTHSLVLRLPWEDYDQLRYHSIPSHKPFLPGAFGILRYSVSSSGVLTIEDVRNEVYERLTSEPLKKKYTQWAELLYHGFTFLTQVRSTQPVNEFTDSARYLSPIEPERLEIASFESISERLKKWTSSPSSFVIAYGTGKDAKKATPIQQPEETVRVMVEVPRLQGFQELKTPHDLDAQMEQKLVRNLLPLSKETFLASDATPARMFRLLPESRFEEIEAYRKQRFPTWWYRNIENGIALAHPLPPDLSKIRLMGLEPCMRRCVRAPARPMDRKRLLNSVELEVLREWEAHTSCTAGSVLKSIFGDDFAMISAAAIEKKDSEWWKIPHPAEPGTHVSFTHLSAQNRHPHLRVVTVNAEGKPTEKFAIGFKGGGFTSVGDAVLPKREPGLVLPFERNEKSSDPFPDPLDQGNPANQPFVWGGKTKSEMRTEWKQAINLSMFTRRNAADLADLVPLPLDGRQYLMIPYWENGKIQWLEPDAYSERFINTYKDDYPDYSVYISSNLSDVRLRQLVERVFIRSEAARYSRGLAETEIETVLRFFFWWNGEDDSLPDRRELTRHGIVDTPAVLRFLAAACEQNPVRAEKLFDRTAGRLAEFVGFLHGAGGHLGGGWRRNDVGQFLGVAWGGPLAMRNVDICGGIHDLDLNSFHLPFVAPDQINWNRFAGEVFELPRSQQYDLMYLGETVYWLRVLTQGDREPRIGDSGTQTVSLNAFNDVFLLDGDDRFTRSLGELLRNVQNNDLKPRNAARLAFPKSIQERYWAGVARGAQHSDH